MARALELAAEADYRTSPNPMVGAVVVDVSGQSVGEGYHVRAGEPHAERVALAQAGTRARGGTLYVTLEPCAHQGRTPPCVEAVVEAGVSRVVAAVRDPYPATAGVGLERLREAGVATEAGVLAGEAEELNRFFLHRWRTGRPYVTAKFAMSLDGKIATRNRESRWISSEESRRHGHELRHQHDTLMVGVGTVLADDPELAARPPARESPRQPLRVILDSRLRTPASAKAVPGALIACTPAASAAARKTLIDAGAQIAELPAGTDGVDVGALLDLLTGRGLNSVLVEGGAGVHGSFFGSRLVQRVHAYVAPVVIGGVEAPGPVGGRGVDRLAAALRLTGVRTMSLGEDVLITAECSRG
jgi:diaminohydroxyphosphoribosylaminopyrimidine deaminase/5-amino-6-(5-phosphoribosylamino)uracil reductase